MKLLFLAAALAAFCLPCLVGTPVPVSAQTTAGSASTITGDWVAQITGEQLFAGTMHLTKVGDTVIGTAQTADGVLQVNGTLKDNVATAKWRGPKGNVGWMTMTFTPSFTGFSGDWGLGGKKSSGQFVARQLTQTEF